MSVFKRFWRLAGVLSVAIPVLHAVALASSAAEREVVIDMDDGFALRGTLYEGDRLGPGVLLFHMCSVQRPEVASRTQYQELARRLVERGMHVLAVDQRGFGDSRSAEWDVARIGQDDFGELLIEQFPRDGQATYRFLQGLPNVDPERIGVVGASCGVLPAGELARTHTAVRAMVLLSSAPRESAELLESRPDLAFFGIGGSRDRIDYAAAMAGLLPSSAHPLSATALYDSAGHGTDLLFEDPELGPRLAAWLRDALAASE